MNKLSAILALLSVLLSMSLSRNMCCAQNQATPQAETTNKLLPLAPAQTAAQLFEQATQLQKQNKLRKAEKLFQQAYQIYTEQRKHEQAAKTQIQLADIYYATQLEHKAEKSLKQALSLYTAINKPELQLHALALLVDLQIKCDNANTFESYWNSLFKLATKQKSKLPLSKTYALKSRWYAPRQPDSALVFLEKAIRCTKPTNHLMRGQYYHRAAKMHQNAQEENKALDKLNQALRHYKAIADYPHKAEVYCEIGQIYALKNRPQQAAEQLYKAYSIAKAYKLSAIIKDCAWLLADMNDAQGKHQTAYELYQEYIAYDDSFYRQKKNKQLAFFNDKYKIQQRDEQLSTQQTEIKAQQEKQKSTTRGKVLVILFLGVVVFIIGFTFRRIKNQQKNNLELAKRTQAIGRQHKAIKARHVELEKQYRLLEEQQEEILVQRNLLEEQSNYAEDQRQFIQNEQIDIEKKMRFIEKMQQNLLPSPRKMNALLRNYFLIYYPQSFVSGDFYWAKKLNSNRLLFITADSTGHGMPGGLMSVLGLSLLNEIVNEKPVKTAAEVLEKLRSRIKQALRSTTGEVVKDGFDISVCLYASKTLELQFAGAYNPLYLVRQNQLNKIKANRFPAGRHLTFERPFTNHVLQLQKNDMLYLFSDGFSDQFGGPDGKKFSSKRFQKLLTEIAHKPLAVQKKQLENAFTNWKGDLSQTDDVVLMGVRI